MIIYRHTSTSRLRGPGMTGVILSVTSTESVLTVSTESVLTGAVITDDDDDDVYLRLQHGKGFHNLVYMSYVKHIDPASKA
jgi:hypothetical protein